MYESERQDVPAMEAKLEEWEIRRPGEWITLNAWWLLLAYAHACGPMYCPRLERLSRLSEDYAGAELDGLCVASEPPAGSSGKVPL